MAGTTLDVTVSRKWQEAQDIYGFEFTHADGNALPPFSAGAHIDVHLPDGLIRQYSLCNDPGSTHHYRIAVLRDANGRGGSRAIHDKVNQGDTIRISAPRNHFALAHAAPHHLLIAGGIGITPILCMAEHLIRAGEKFDLHYCARSRERAAFVEPVTASPFGNRTALYFDDETHAPRFDIAATLANAPAESHLYVCGPRGFMDAVLAEARRQQWDETRLHYEFFGGIVEQSSADAAFQVRIASSGATIDVPTGCTVIEALAANGVDVLTSCEQGVCGTCITRVIEGRPDHRDAYLTDEEKAAGDQFLPCCSRSHTPLLVLDL
ncbi:MULTISPECIES: PDR/VanB family oxidoreductase [unclassified Paraburkholderia]|uniref:PDR/VanB family oxidoreductase n=1 Tax=unclassified Paraburkholderia TaxID=2615204 RepID=UPI002AAF4CD3|nr:MULTISPECIES: PDR/VanB family oxidoreductase [unclassified Paraburkholderia]